MTLVNNKHERDSMPFPFRWFDTLLCLNDQELRSMLTAMKNYAKDGSMPDFNGVMSALWSEIKDRISHDKKHYQMTCEHRRENVKKRWDKQNTNVMKKYKCISHSSRILSRECHF